MPDAHESCRKAPSQPHKCSRFIVYTNPQEKAQALIDFFVGMFTGRVHPPSGAGKMVSPTRGMSFWEYVAFSATSFDCRSASFGEVRIFPQVRTLPQDEQADD